MKINGIFSERKGRGCHCSDSDFKIKQGCRIRLRPETGPECIVDHIAGVDLETFAADPGCGSGAVKIYEAINEEKSRNCLRALQDFRCLLELHMRFRIFSLRCYDTGFRLLVILPEQVQSRNEMIERKPAGFGELSRFCIRLIRFYDGDSVQNAAPFVRILLF